MSNSAPWFPMSTERLLGFATGKCLKLGVSFTRDYDEESAPSSNRILELFVSIGIFLLVWGIFLQIARMFHFSLSQLGLVATPVALAIALLYLIRTFRDINPTSLPGWMFREEGWLLIISLGFGVVRFFMLLHGSDALVYLSGAAHHLANPDSPLRFDMPGHYMSESQPLVGYWMSSTLEYFWAYASLISSVPLPVLYFRLMPAIAIVLAVWSSYCLLLAFGASRRSGLFLTLATLCILLFNLSGGSFGEWTLLRSFTPRALFNAFILNIMLCLVLKSNTDTDKAKICLQALLFSAGFALTSQSVPYLMLAAAEILFITSVVTNQIQKQECQNIFQFLLFISFAIPPIAVIFAPHFIGTADLYGFTLSVLNEMEITDRWSSFHRIWNTVFSEFHFGHLAVYMMLLGLNFYICYRYRDWRCVFLLIFASIYIFFILNPLTFELIKLTSAKYRVFWRFYYIFPVMLYPTFIFLMCISLHRRLLIGVAASLYLLLFFCFAHTGMDNLKTSFAEKFAISGDVNLGETYTSKWLTSSLGKSVDGRLLFAYRIAAYHYAVFSPETILLANKHQFLPLCFLVKDALDITWAQQALGVQKVLNAKQKKSLGDVLDKYQPDIVVVRRLERGDESPARAILQDAGYSFRKGTHPVELYTRD